MLWSILFYKIAHEIPLDLMSAMYIYIGASSYAFGTLMVYFSNRNTLVAMSPPYIVARFALLTVACTAFRRMPVSAFDTSNWFNYWGPYWELRAKQGTSEDPQRVALC